MDTKTVVKETEKKLEKKRPQKNAEDKKRVAFWRNIFTYLQEYRKNAVIAILFSALTGVAVAFQPLVIKYIVDEGITVRKSVSYVAIACLIYLAIASMRMLFFNSALKHVLTALEGTLFNLRCKVFSHVGHLCMRFYDKKSAGELYNCIMGSPMTNMRGYLQSMLISVPYQLVSFVISLVALASYDWVLTANMLVTAASMATLNFLSKNVIRKASRDYIAKESETSKYLTDIFHGMDSIKMYSIENDAEQKFSRYLTEMRNSGIRHIYSVHKENLKPEFATYLGTAVVYLVGAVFCIHRGLTVGILYAFLSSMGSILSTLTSWLGLSLQKSAADVGMAKILELIEETTSTPELPDEELCDAKESRISAMESGKPCIEFDNVRFAYDKKQIFNSLSCAVKFNESVALVGGSGSGKSTFTKLLMRLYETDGGSIRVNGEDIKKYHLHDLRYSIGIVPQSPFIFQGTIWDNIRIACPEASNYEIIQAMEIAHVHEFVNELPLGWCTRIGDGELSLSGGQKQRIAIARAVLKNPDILIFDEATSALDNISEKHIQQSMEELMKTHTVIIVAHRLSTIKNVDRILVFERGEIVEEGKYDELAKKEGGAFRALLDCVENS
jgi:ABC-type multidrug transport system fused ATPase/permease subunit